MFTSSAISARLSAGVLTEINNISLTTLSLGDSSRMSSTLISLVSCFTICSIGVSSASTTMVMRDRWASSVGATASETMLYPRREISEVTRARTPNLFSTRTDNV